MKPVTGAILLATTSLFATNVQASPMPQTSPAPAAAPVNPAPMLDKWPGPFDGVPQWDKVTPAMFGPAFEKGMAEARAEFAKIRDNPAAPTFANTIEASEKNSGALGRVFPVWGVYTSNLATPEVQKIAAEWSPKLSAFFTEMSLDPKMFQRVKTLYDTRQTLGLNPQQLRLLERTYRGYVTSGALLDAVSASIKDITGRETKASTSGGTSDGRFIATMGTQVVELGPVNATIHQVNERVLASDLDVLTEIYYQTLIKLLA